MLKQSYVNKNSNDKIEDFLDENSIHVIDCSSPYAFKKLFDDLAYKMPYSNIYNIKSFIKEVSYLRLPEIINMLNDSDSKYILSEYVKNRELGATCFDNTYNPDVRQYFPEKYFTYSIDEIFVDVGVYDAFTSYDFFQQVNGEFKAIYAYEPNPICYRISKKHYVMMKMPKEKVYLQQKGLSNINATVKLVNVSMGGSYIDELAGEYEVDVCRLDDEIKEVSFIKMDIEGSELKALMGAEDIIKKCKPKIAVCIYHQPEDIWTIPYYLKKIVPQSQLPPPEGGGFNID